MTGRFAVVFLMTLFFPLGDLVRGWLGDDPARRGAAAYRAGRYAEAAAAYREALGEGGAAARERYGLGTALLRQERWDEARAELERASDAAEAREDTVLRVRAAYNAGNADLEPVFRGTASEGEREARLRRAVARYRAALTLSPGDGDAKWNLELAQRLLAQDGGGGGGAGEDQGGGGDDGEDEAPSEGGGEEGPEPEGPTRDLTRQQAERVLAGAEDAEREVQRRQLKAGQGSTRPLRDW